MPSLALQRWRFNARKELDEIEAAHRAIGGHGRGRRYATQQINHAYAVLLSSQFQRFCRELHSEAIHHLGSAISNPALRDLFQSRLMADRKLDRGNPTPGNIGSDFNRLGMKLWPAVLSMGTRNRVRQERLEDLTKWRNAIAHQDFDPAILGPTPLRLMDVRQWREVCNGLAVAIDNAASDHLAIIMGNRPW